MVHRKSSEAHDVIRPTTDRAPLAVAITISGKDRSGRPFAENTRTVEISGRGARISTAHELLLGSEISVENALGQTAAAKVLWRSETGVCRGFNEFGIVLLTSSAAESLWRDVPSPGEPDNAPPRKDPLSLDWLDEKQAANGAPPPDSRTEDSGPTLAQASSDFAPDAAVKPIPTPPGEESSTALQLVPGPSSADRPSLPLDESIRPAEQAQPDPPELSLLVEPGNDNHLEPALQASDAAATVIEPSTEASSGSGETQAPFSAIDVNIVLKSINLATDEAVARLQAATGAAESDLTARIEGYEQRLSGLVSRAIAMVEEESKAFAESLRERALSDLEMLERSSGELQEKGLATVRTANDKLLTLTAGLIDEASGQISRAAQAASESLGHESQRVSQSQTQAIEVLNKQAEAASRTAVDATASLAVTRQQTEAALQAKVAEVSAALKSIDSSAAEVVSRLRAAQEAMESALTAKVEETERRLSGLAASTVAVIEEKSGILGESLRERALRLGREMLERSTGELLKEKASVVQTAGEELSILTTGLIDEASGRISRAAQAASELLAQESKRISESQAQEAAALKEYAGTTSGTPPDAAASLAAAGQMEAALEAKVAEASTALKSLDASAAEIASRLRAEQEAMESSLTTKIAEAERRLNGLAASTVAIIEEKSGTLGESLRERALSLGLKMLERSSGELLRQKANVVQTASEELLTLTAGLIEKASSQVERAAQAASESLAQESKRISELQAQAISALKEQAESASRTAVDATATLAATRQQTEAALEAKVAEVSVALKSIASSADGAACRLRAAQEAMEPSLAAKVEEAERRLSGLASSAVTAIEERSRTLGESLRERALSLGLEMLERSSDELQKQKASVVQTAGEELSTMTAGRIDKARGQLELAAQTATEWLAQEGKRVSEYQGQQFLQELKARRLDAVRDAGEDLRSLKAEIEDEAANQLIQVAEGALASLGRDCQRMLEEHKNRASQILAEQTQTLAGNTEAAISSLDSTHERLATALRSRIAENEKCLADQLNAATETLDRNREALLKSSHDQAERELSLLRQEATHIAYAQMRGNADRALHDWAQQLQQQTEEAKHTVSLELAAARAEVTEQMRKELSDLTRAALASLTQEIRALTTEQGDELRQGPGAIREQGSDALEETQPQWQEEQSVVIRKDHGRHQLGAPQKMFSQPYSAPTIGARTVVQRLRLLFAVIGVVAVVAGVAFSVRPVRRLKTMPPDAFFDKYYRVAEGGSLQAAEQRLAQAYWECALQRVQPRYAGDADLPESPPPEFRVDVKRIALGRFKEDGDTRLGYWQRLRAVWASPDTWNESYEWNTDWIRRLLSSPRASPPH